jgi:imidazolonepropionase-like amidohydrolase
MEREIEQAGAQSPDEIRAAVKAAWKKITPAMCHAISARVRKNMLKVIELKGGNFYDE